MSKVLVAFFSASGVTAKLAERFVKAFVKAEQICMRFSRRFLTQKRI